MARHGVDLIPESPLRCHVDDYLRHLELERGCSLNTVDAYARDLAKYLNWLVAPGNTEETREAVTDFSQVTPGLLDTYVSELAEMGLAVSTRARMTVAVRRLHTYLHAEGATPTDPSTDLIPPTDALRLPKALSVDDIQALLATIPGDGAVNLRATAIIEFLYATGARISEAAALDISDLYLEEKIVRL